MLAFLTAVTASNVAKQGEGCYMMGPPGIGFTKTCAAGLQCVGNTDSAPDFVDDGYKTCQPVNLGDSPAGYGEECWCPDCGPDGVTRTCEAGLTCFNPCVYSNPDHCVGGEYTCGYPWEQSHALGASRQFRVTCSVRPPAIGTWLCDEGEICIDHKCTQPTLGKSNQHVCTVAPPKIGAWLCPEGQICENHKCVYPRVGASGPAQEGEECACADCGPAGITRDCAAGLVCINPCEFELNCEGGMSTCQRPGASLGASNREVCTVEHGLGAWLCPEGQKCVNHQCVTPSLGSSNRVACSVAPPAIGTWLCEEGEICVNHHCILPGVLPPSLGASNREVCTVENGLGAWLCPEGQKCVNHQCVTPSLGASNREVCTAEHGDGAWLCPEGQKCVNHQCVTPSLGASPPAQEGEECACADCGPAGITRDCAAGLVCINPCEFDPHCVGGMSICQRPGLPSVGASNREVCTVEHGLGAWLCPEGQKCVNHQCVTPSLGSSNRVTCSVAPPAIGTWLCQEGEICVNHRCILRGVPTPSLGASGDNWTGCHNSSECPQGKQCILEVFGADVHGTCQ